MECSGTFMFDTNCQRMEISVEHGRVVTTLNIINTLNILFSVVEIISVVRESVTI